MGLQPLHLPPELTVQQHQIRPKLTRSLHRFFSRVRDRHDGIAKQNDRVTQILGDERLIFRDQNAGFFQKSIPPALETGQEEEPRQSN